MNLQNLLAKVANGNKEGRGLTPTDTTVYGCAVQCAILGNRNSVVLFLEYDALAKRTILGQERTAISPIHFEVGRNIKESYILLRSTNEI